MTEYQQWLDCVSKCAPAARDGQVIQTRASNECEWVDLRGEHAFLRGWCYRIKPVPKYRPFTLEESGVLMAGKVRHEDYGWATVECVTKSGLANVLYASGGMSSIDLATMLGRFIFADTGKPCGVLVEGEAS